MIQFICGSLVCIQTYFGGLSTNPTFYRYGDWYTYSNYQKEYTCQIVGDIHYCTSRDLMNR
jgi:hypothetical protein